MLSRRQLIKRLAAAGLLTTISPEILFAQPSIKGIGIQLYTIRDLVSADLIGSLKKLAAIGYSTIETAGYNNRQFYGKDPVEFGRSVRELGLEPLSSHSAVNMQNIEATVEDALKAGMKYIVLPWIPEDQRKSLDSYKQLAQELNKMGEVCRRNNIHLGYHNHDFEFYQVDGITPYKLLLENTDPELVFMQIDTYWVVYAGADPADFFKKHPGRFKLWHVKDMMAGETKESTEVGAGVLDFPKLFEMSKLAGLEHVIVEQEAFRRDPWDSLEISYKYLSGLNY